MTSICVNKKRLKQCYAKICRTIYFFMYLLGVIANEINKSRWCKQNLAKFASLSSSFFIRFHIEFHDIRRVRSLRILPYIFFKKRQSEIFIVVASRLSFCQTFNLCILAKQGGGKKLQPN